MTYRKAEIRTQGAALGHVASHVHGWLHAGTLSESTGIPDDELRSFSNAEVRRLEHAVDVVKVKLLGLVPRVKADDASQDQQA